MTANTASFRPAHGGGTHGYMAIVFDPDSYATLIGHIFELPTYPAQFPVIPVRDTAAQIGQLERKHATNRYFPHWV